MRAELICFFLFGTAAFLLDTGLSSQALPLFWLVLPFLLKINLQNILRKVTEKS